MIKRDSNVGPLPRATPTESDQVRPNLPMIKIRPNPTESNQVWPEPTKSDWIRANPTESDQVRLNQSESDRIRPSLTESKRIRSKIKIRPKLKIRPNDESDQVRPNMTKCDRILRSNSVGVASGRGPHCVEIWKHCENPGRIKISAKMLGSVRNFVQGGHFQKMARRGDWTVQN